MNTNNNLTINFSDINFYADEIHVNNDSIYLVNSTRNSLYGYLTMNITEVNKNYNGGDVPYISYFRTLTVIIHSNLTSSLNVVANIPLACDGIKTIKYTRGNGVDLISYSDTDAVNSCNSFKNGYTVPVDYGDNTIYLSYTSGSPVGSSGGSSIIDQIVTNSTSNAESPNGSDDKNIFWIIIFFILLLIVIGVLSKKIK
jgi:hypothetical protein